MREWAVRYNQVQLTAWLYFKNELNYILCDTFINAL